MKFARFVLVLVVIAYAGWLAWPVVSPFLEGAPMDVATARAGAQAEAGGGLPQAALWIGAVALYLVAAFLLGSGDPRAAVAYFLGFMADAVLRLAIDRGGAGPDGAGGAGDLTRRSVEAVAPGGLPVDPTWLVLGALLVLGLFVVGLSRRRGRHPGPGKFTP